MCERINERNGLFAISEIINSTNFKMVEISHVPTQSHNENVPLNDVYLKLKGIVTSAEIDHNHLSVKQIFDCQM